MADLRVALEELRLAVWAAVEPPLERFALWITRQLERLSR